MCPCRRASTTIRFLKTVRYFGQDSKGSRDGFLAKSSLEAWGTKAKNNAHFQETNCFWRQGQHNNEFPKHVWFCGIGTPCLTQKHLAKTISGSLGEISFTAQAPWINAPGSSVLVSGARSLEWSDKFGGEFGGPRGPRVSPLWRRRALELGVPLAQAHSRPPCERNARGVGQTSRFERRVGALRISGLNENKNQTGKDIQTWHASTKTEMHDCVTRRCGSGIWYWWTLGAKAT
jgi:hypothetical protein